MLLFRAETTVVTYGSVELACLKKKERKKEEDEQTGGLDKFQFSTFAMVVSDFDGLVGYRSPEYEVRVDLPEILQSGIAYMWETRKHTDVTFLLGNSRVTAHRAILASQSEYFDRLLFGEMREAHAGAEITLKDTPLVPFELLMKYAYSGSMEMKDIPMEGILEVVSLVDRFDFTALKEAIGVQLADLISTSNVLELMVHADYSHLPELHEKCLQFSDENAEEVLKSEAFLSLPAQSLQGVISRDTFLASEVAIFQAVLRWKEHNSSASEEGLSQVLGCIRLTEISQGEIFDVVEPCGLFDESKILQALRAQTKLTLKHLRPRGKKVPNENLFATRATTLMCHHPLISPNHGVKPPAGLLYPPPMPICEGYVRLDEYTLQLQLGLTIPAVQFDQPCQLQKAPSQSSVVISLGNTPYLINEIEFQGYPEMANVGGSTISVKTFSYTIGVSRDNQKWMQLANYTQFSCYSKQHLTFPVQAARYIRFELTGRANTDQQFTVHFSSCSFVQDQKPFAVRKDGVIAPMTPLSPPGLLKRVTNGDLLECIRTFNQPYSISTLSFSVCVSNASSVQLVDLLVAVQGSSQGEYEDVSTLKKQRIGTRLTISFKERVVSVVKVVIKEVKNPHVPNSQVPSTAPISSAVATNFLTGLPPTTTAAFTSRPPLSTTATSVRAQSQFQGSTAFSFAQLAHQQAFQLPQALPGPTIALPTFPFSAASVSPAHVYSIKGLICQAGT